MITRTIECDGAKMIVRRRTHQGRLMVRHLRELMSEIVPEYRERYGLLNEGDLSKALEGLSEGDHQRFIFTLDFMNTCGCVIGASGLPLPWPLPGELPSLDWAGKMWRHYLVSGEDGIWAEAERVIDTMDAPQTPVEQRPEEVLSAAEAGDPLS